MPGSPRWVWRVAPVSAGHQHYSWTSWGPFEYDCIRETHCFIVFGAFGHHYVFPHPLHTHTHTRTLQGHKEVYWRMRIYLDPSKLQGDSFSPDSIKAIWHLVDPCFKKLVYSSDITQYHRMSIAPILHLYIKLLKVTWPLENHID